MQIKESNPNTFKPARYILNRAGGIERNNSTISNHWNRAFINPWETKKLRGLIKPVSYRKSDL